MTIEQILTYLASLAPSVVAIVTAIVTFIKLVKKTDISNKEVASEFQELKAQVSTLTDDLKAAHAENRELKKLVARTLEETTKVKMKEE